MRVIVGTAKGAFVLSPEQDRAHWKIEGPLFKGWKVTAAARDPQGRYLLGTASDVYGPAIQTSEDLRSWKQIEHGPEYPAGGPKLKQIWTLVPGTGRWYAGVDEAGLFASEDGRGWKPMEGLNHHPTREAWVPGAGGLCAHTLLEDRTNPKRLWCGISAVGVFRSDDGGATWSLRNSGVPAMLEDPVHKDIGRCVHALAQDPKDANTLYRQDHAGMFRTRNGGDTWERIENGLSSRYGFPLALDRRTRRLYCVPLESDESRMMAKGEIRVYRSADQGASWEPLSEGLPERTYTGVLRSALAADSLEPCGIYLGTTSGTIHVSRNGGESWQTLPCTLPRILCVAALVDP
jgi:hypothetical protein